KNRQYSQQILAPRENRRTSLIPMRFISHSVHLAHQTPGAMIRLLISLTLVALLAACGQQNANLDERLSVLTAQIIQNPGAAENANRQKEIMDILNKLGGEQYINEVAEHVYNDTTGTIDEARAKQYIAACEAFALIHKGTDKGADYLYKATETLRALRQPEKCLAIYDQLIMDYP